MGKTVDCILLIDDSFEDNFFHKRVIEKSGKVNQVRIANNGLEGLEYLTAGGDNPRPNIIFLDINMPKMNGFEFLEEYQKLEDGQKAEICIVMLTTSRNPEDMAKAISFEKVANFATKPLTLEFLTQVIDTYEEIAIHLV